MLQNSEGHFGLHVWRAVAVACLLIGHFFPGFGYGDGVWINFGRLGVELFFVLSGCLLANGLNEQVSIRIFLLNRFIRIFPSLLIFCCFCFCILILRGRDTNYFYCGVGFVANVCTSINPANTPVVMAHLWSVALEMQGYFLMALLAVISRWSGIKFCNLLLCVVILAAIILISNLGWGDKNEYHDYLLLPPMRLVGMYFAAYMSIKLKYFEGRGLYWLCGLILGLIMNHTIIPDTLKYTVGSMALAVSCVLVQRSHHLSKIPSFQYVYKVPMILSSASYSIYLWQQLFFHFSDLQQDFWRSVLLLIFALVAGIVMHYGFDGVVSPKIRYFSGRYMASNRVKSRSL